MTVWYYAVGQEQKGPVREDELRDLIRGGQVKKETFVWREGMDTWQAASERSELAATFSSPPPLPAPSVTLSKLPPPAFPPPTPKDGAVIASRPWPRFWARLIDNLLFMPLLGFGIGLLSVFYAPDIYLELVAMNQVLYGILIIPVVCLFLALLMTVTGTTLGKLVMGIRVPVPPGRNRFFFFLGREFKVWAAGLGLGIPFVALFTQVNQYRRLASGQAASYDEGNPGVVSNPSGIRLAAAIVLVLILFAGNVILRSEDERSETNLVTSQTWVNPVTGKSATIGKTWQPTEMQTNNGRAFHFTSNELLSDAIFGYEQYSANSVVTSVSYANAIKQAIASEISIDTEWSPVTVLGMPALRASGKSLNYADSVVEVTILVAGHNAWRTLVFSRGNSAAQGKEKERFVQAMFGTMN
ncbi:RDD family protein [Rhizobium laguerreae]|nr:RDD family protein [Rhizobium laguerreae]